MQTAIETGCFDQVILSSEDSEILETARNNPQVAMSLRPPELSQDDVRADDVIRWEINRLSLSQSDTVCCLLPTTPLLTPEVLLRARSEFSNLGVLFGVVETTETPFRSFQIHEKSGQLKSLFPDMLLKQSHEYPKTVVDAGQFYFANALTWIENYSITATMECVGFLLKSDLAIDINHPEDWNRLNKTR
jgi:N-acylneuraminate cytidylyltransferase